MNTMQQPHVSSVTMCQTIKSLKWCKDKTRFIILAASSHMHLSCAEITESDKIWIPAKNIGLKTGKSIPLMFAYFERNNRETK